MTQTFSTLTLKLLQGHIIDDITEPALMNWLDDESNFGSLQDYLAKINRQVLFTNDKRGAYLGFIELYDKDSSQAIRQSFSQISLTLFPLILWLRLVRGATDSSRPLQAGDNIHLSDLLASIESSKQLELQLADIISKIGRQTKEAKKQLYSLADYLENTGYLHPAGSNGMIYKATAKWSLLYDQLEYLALGFLLSEGLIDKAIDLLDWEVTHLDTAALLAADNLSTAERASLIQQLADYEIYQINLRLNQRCHQRIQAQRRQLSGRTGCGMCGMTGLAQALPDLSAYQQSSVIQSAVTQTTVKQSAKNLLNQLPDQLSYQAQISSPPPEPSISTKSSTSAKFSTVPSLAVLLDIRQRLNTAQQAHLLTGAVHAAACLYEDKLMVFEDVGRHNALDKLIGWQLRLRAQDQALVSPCVVMTSRISIELVQKAIRAQIAWLVGMSAPTSTAVRTANRYGLGLAGFLRDNRVTYYTGIDDCK